jgi:hypothetical protein
MFNLLIITLIAIIAMLDSLFFNSLAHKAKISTKLKIIDKTMK